MGWGKEARPGEHATLGRRTSACGWVLTLALGSSESAALRAKKDLTWHWHPADDQFQHGGWTYQSFPMSSQCDRLRWTIGPLVQQNPAQEHDFHLVRGLGEEDVAPLVSLDRVFHL